MATPRIARGMSRRGGRGPSPRAGAAPAPAAGGGAHTHPPRGRRADKTPPPPKPYHPFFFFNDTATTEIYTLSLHDALPISFLVCSEAHHFDGGDKDIVQAAEDGDAKDRTRYVTAGLLRLLAERRSSLEPGEGEEPEHHAEEQRRRPCTIRYREHREVQGVAVRGRTGRESDQDNDADDEDERHRRTLDH